MKRDFDPLNFYLGIASILPIIREAALVNVPCGQELVVGFCQG